MTKEEGKLLGEVAKQISKDVYSDGLKPSVVQVGKAAGTVTSVINMALTPVSLMVHGFDQIEKVFKEKLENKLSKLPEEQIIKPPLSIVGPLIEKYKFNYDKEELSEMFVNLLANSMDAQKSSETHPSFVEVIGQLSSDEAILFKEICSLSMCPKIDIGIELSQVGHGVNIVRENIIETKLLQKINHPEFVSSYLDNLQRLGLIACTKGINQDYYTTDNVYNELQNDPYVKSLKSSLAVSKIGSMKIIKGCIKVTSYGRTFIRSVTR